MSEVSSKAVVTGSVAACAAVVLAASVFIGPKEGLSLTPYADIVGKATWCYGETRGTPKARYTKAECDAMLQEGVGQFHAAMRQCIHKPLTQGQWVAVTSLAYNAGSSAICGSTLVRQINAGYPATTWCQQLLRWDRAGGKQVRGLTRRRQAEYLECIA